VPPALALLRPDYIISLEDGRRTNRAPSVESRPHSGALSPEVGSTSRLPDGRGELRQGSIRVGEPQTHRRE
jgi:hypothetical protein